MKMFTALIAGFTVLLSVQAFGGIVDSLPSETKIVAKVDMQSLRDSSIYKSVREKYLVKFEEMEFIILKEAGLDIGKINFVWLAGVEDKKGIIIIEGEFAADKISAAMGMNKENKKLDRSDCLFAAMCPDKNVPGKKNLAAVIDSKLAVVGDPEIAEEFLNNYNSGKGGFSAEKANSLASSFNGKYLLKASLIGFRTEDVAKNPILANVTGAELSVNLEGGISADAKILMKNEENVVAVEQILNGFTTIIKANPNADEKNKEVRDEFLNNLSIVRNGKELTARTKLSNSVIDKVIKDAGDVDSE